MPLMEMSAYMIEWQLFALCLMPGCGGKVLLDVGNTLAPPMLLLFLFLNQSS